MIGPGPKVLAAARSIIERRANDVEHCAQCGCRAVTHDASGRCRLDGDLCPGYELAVPDDLRLALYVVNSESLRQFQSPEARARRREESKALFIEHGVSPEQADLVLDEAERVGESMRTTT